MCTVLGVARSTYYKSFDKTKSARELENEELKSAIKRIYKDNKGIYGAPRIHYILGIEGFNVSLKRVQRLMTKLNLCAVTVKKYKPHSSKKVVEDLENVLKRDFTTTYINEKWVGDITYIHTSRDGWCYLASALDLHSKKIIGYAFGKRMTNDLVVKALKNAYYNQNPNKNKHIIFHTDLGSQYTSNDLKELCKEFNIIQSYLSFDIASSTLSVTSYALISGFKSYVSTFGDGTNILSSPSYCFSSPPLKKNVTCAYFSVSAILNCVYPNLLTYSPNVLTNGSFLNAIFTFGIVSS